MSVAVKELKEDIVEKLAELPKADIQELHNYLVFLEMKPYLPKIDPSQAYFWTKKWQKMEREADADKKAGRILGTGKVKALLKSLKHAD